MARGLDEQSLYDGCVVCEYCSISYQSVTGYFSLATMTTGVSVRTAVSLCDVLDGQLYADDLVAS